MRMFTAPKIGAIALGVLLSVVLLGQSVTQHIPETSAKRPSAVNISTKKVPVSRVAAVTKKKRSAARPFLATTIPTTQVAKTPLLAAVDKADITDAHKKLMDRVLRALPPQCGTHLQNFYIQYTGATRRGLGGKTTIILDGSVPDAELVALLIHECAHVTHANMVGTAASGLSAFKDGKEVFYADSPIAAFFGISWTMETVMKRGMKADDFVSGYAKSDAFEDFAETYAMYILQRPAMRERAQTNDVIAAKLKWMETYLPISEDAVGVSGYSWDKKVPWDITKLSYNLTVN